jgi:type IV pilus assembly protein PilO
MLQKLTDILLPRPFWQRVSLVVVTDLLIAGIVWQFIVFSGFTARNSLIEEVQRNDTMLLKEFATSGQHEQVKSEQGHLNDAITGALARLPGPTQVEDLLQGISQRAVEAGLDLKLFQQRESKAGAWYVELPVNVSVAGSFRDLLVFFDSITRLSSLVTIDQLKLSRAQGGGDVVLLQADFTLTAIRPPAPSEQAEANAKAPQKGA